MQKILFCDCRADDSDNEFHQLISNVIGDKYSNISILNENEQIEWEIKTKYYEATVTIDVRRLSEFENDESGHRYAAVVLLTGGKSDCERAQRAWSKTDGSADIRLLVTVEASDEGEESQWCMSNEFELIGLNEARIDDGLEDEIWGWRRVRSALEAHDWCNLVSDSVSDEERHQEAFEELLGRLGDVKSELERASGTERHRLAEEITLQFWRAMGGSDTELNDICD